MEVHKFFIHLIIMKLVILPQESAIQLIEKGRSVTRSPYLCYLSNSFLIGVKYNKTNIAPEIAQLNPSIT